MYRFTKKLNPAGSSAYGGNFVRDKTLGKINGKPVFVNKEKKIFLASYPKNKGWHIVNLYYWDEVSMKQGHFGSLCHGSTPTPQTGYGDKDWRDYIIEYQKPRNHDAPKQGEYRRMQDTLSKQGEYRRNIPTKEKKKIEF